MNDSFCVTTLYDVKGYAVTTNEHEVQEHIFLCEVKGARVMMQLHQQCQGEEPCTTNAYL